MKFPFKKNYLTDEQVYEAIESLINGKGEAWDWDDFLHAPINDPYLKKIQQKCLDLPDEYPRKNSNKYCGEEGFKILQHLSADLKARIESKKNNS